MVGKLAFGLPLEHDGLKVGQKLAFLVRRVSKTPAFSLRLEHSPEVAKN
jgi:hypothetical protein